MASLKLNHAGIAELLKSDAMAEDLRRRAEAIARAAGDGHEVDVEVGDHRARAAVITDTFEAKVREARKRSLTSAIEAGR